MGMSYCDYRGLGSNDVVDFLFNHLRLVRDSPGVQRRVLKTAKVGSTVYAAMEILPEAGERQVMALVILTRIHHGELGYQDMSECDGPVQAQCPPSILKLLTPTDSQWAKDWRDSCWANAKAAKERVVKPGEVVLMETPLSFKTGVQYRVFEKDPRRSVWRSLQEDPHQWLKVGDRLDYVRFSLKGFTIAERFPSREAFIASRQPPALPPVDDTPLVMPEITGFGDPAAPSSQPSLALNW